MKEQLLGQLNAAIEFFDRSTRALDEADSSFAPAEGVFTAAQQVAHAAQTIDWFVEGAFRPGGFDMDFEAHDKKVRAVTSLAEARAWLTRAVTSAREAIESKPEQEWAQPLPEGPIMGGLPRAAILGGITDHTAHHRGALTVYARLRGKVPPMPYGDMP
ncbi:MAG: DinB family protein [Vicinamibacterales bacterium]|jgi:uncharacterized damage-inducible protein DinB|nr:hypothetical protein [Acidobacteriota bacterium]MDP6371551.1 DinB family protein [Vicinamibacterales bacterium]MDP6609723.1 DinB family protein [Vicinamibacterales bacterium]HAK57224.1 hypothetical protein [Acidobacteriota bacterium]|tara:strand:+ start:7881 stop:8357 length:477 start_codon:yes stop_codon:yes gene_type:complete